MGAALAAHDEVLRVAVAEHGGWLFKHTGDGICAAFSSARSAVAAAVAAQRLVALPVRMGVHTGEAEPRGEDYFGPALNRAARVMAAGHGGQILVTATSGALAEGVELRDLGEHRLRDLSGVERLFEVRAEGLLNGFPPLRTIDAVPGNLQAATTGFIGRDSEVQELVDLVRAHRLVTVTGVGGVGKSRLAVQTAAMLLPDFPDGVWLVELAPVGGPEAVQDAVATALGITLQAGLAATDGIARALAGRKLLIVLDNCEHVVTAAADLVDAVLARTAEVRVLATSREGLRIASERLWMAPPLDLHAGVSSEAVALFVDRAQAVNAAFSLESSVDAAAVIEICRRLDGIALAIELAAARMVSMSPSEVLERLADRFRLLGGTKRGVERHQTLRQAVQWSYDLLDDDERSVLNCAAVFSDGFDVAAVSDVYGDGVLDEYALLDTLDSLVRKSLLTARRVDSRTRFGMLETIRQFAEERLSAEGQQPIRRNRHAAHFAARASSQWMVWDASGHREPLGWVELEFANLRAAFRWSIEQADTATAAAIAAHTSMLAHVLQRFEPAGWAEEILPAVQSENLRLLPRVLTAASYCAFTGRPEDAVGFAHAAVSLEGDDRFDAFATGWSGIWEAGAHAYAGRPQQCLDICSALASTAGFARLVGLCGSMVVLPVLGRAEEAVGVAEKALVEARQCGHPYWLAFVLYGYGRVFAELDPPKALAAWRQGLDCAREYGLRYREARLTQEAARLEATHGELRQAFAMFDASIDAQHRSGERTTLAITLGNLAVLFERLDEPQTAATLFGATRSQGSTVLVIGLPAMVERLQARLTEAELEHAVSIGALMEQGDVVRYARRSIEAAADRLEVSREVGPSPPRACG